MRFCIATTIFVLCCLQSLLLGAQNFSGTYTGTYEGNALSLVLRADGDALSGTLSDGQSIFDISAYGQGNYWVGTATDKNTQVQAIIAGELKASQLEVALTIDIEHVITLSLQRLHQGATLPPTGQNYGQQQQATTSPSAKLANKGNVDAQLVGSWVKSLNNSSGYGSDMAYLQTDVLFRINADGAFEYGATRSVGGGSNWSYDGSQWSAPQFSGILRSEGNHIYVLQSNGQAVPEAQQKMGTYFIDGNRMATTGNDGKKEYWTR